MLASIVRLHGVVVGDGCGVDQEPLAEIFHPWPALQAGVHRGGVFGQAELRDQRVQQRLVLAAQVDP